LTGWRSLWQASKEREPWPRSSPTRRTGRYDPDPGAMPPPGAPPTKPIGTSAGAAVDVVHTPKATMTRGQAFSLLSRRCRPAGFPHE
jgi:hypothetical protein